ncbi:MAG TPA: SpoIID/LytB domain-containing protein [Leptospiraceae bacterium]|nr:SpoIID/LytB domain-containing protein [Leptospiraceae bacterium]
MLKVFILLSYFSLLPLFAESIKIGILSKYNLSEIDLDISDNTRMFYDGRDLKLKKGLIKVYSQKDKIHFGKSIIAKSILINASENIKLSFSKENHVLERNYKGDLEFISLDGRLQLVLSIPLEEYVSSAVQSELGELLQDGRYNSEAHKKELIAAQEIVIRTFIKKEKDRHEKEPYDFCDLTHCLHFEGTQKTKSIYPGVILKGKDSISGYFHSNCGGILSGPEVYWAKHEISTHYKRGKDGVSAYCSDSPHSEWETILTERELENILNDRKISNIFVVEKQNRVSHLKYKSEQFIKTIPISTFISRTGKLYGWNKIKSNLFKIQKLRERYLFVGKGLGHGIGLCQWGSAKLAANGKTYREILEFYFPDTELSKQ